MGRGRELEAAIRISGQLDASLRNAVNQAVDRLSNMNQGAQHAADAVDELSETMDRQRAALQAAQRQYTAYILRNEQGSQRAQELANNIRELSSDLSQNEQRMRYAQNVTQELSQSIDDASDGFTVMKGAIANLIGNGISALIAKCQDAISSLYGLSESTREYREDMGKLETAWESANKSTELATQAYKQFYSALGEEDRSVEAVNHLAKFVDTEADLTKWTNIAIGV